MSAVPEGSRLGEASTHVVEGDMMTQGVGAGARLPLHPNRAVESRCFWQAGNYGASSTRNLPSEELELSRFERTRVHPKFLHSNATSHKWAFGAIAELLDNAVDEVCNGATFVKVDRVWSPRDKTPALLFHDDGGGMDPTGLRRCMSLGFSAKKGDTMIGQYGNGFKTSTMRLGADVIVFTRSENGGRSTRSVGLLSYTFLMRTMEDDVIVPLIDFEAVGGQILPLIVSSQADWDDNLKTILKWSPFSSLGDLMMQFEDIGTHGTKVIIYNLWHDDDGLLELDFEDEDDDIKLRESSKSVNTKPKDEVIRSHISCSYLHSLRAYVSILYLREFTTFSVILRGKPVQHLNIAGEMKFSKRATYRPHVETKDVSVGITIGFAKEAPLLGIYGINVYHKNRLVMPFWKVFQDSSNRGRCVIGLLEANFIEPAHDKQDFERTPLFIRLETRLKLLIGEYWRDNCHLIGYTPQNPELRSMHQNPARSSHENVLGASREMSSTRFAARHLAGAEPVVNYTNNNQSGATPQPTNGLATARDSRTVGTIQEFASSSPDGSSFGHAEVSDMPDPAWIDKLREENIQLFMRRNELKDRDSGLRQMIDMLENELEDAKKRCSKLESDLEIRKRQFLQ